MGRDLSQLRPGPSGSRSLAPEAAWRGPSALPHAAGAAHRFQRHLLGDTADSLPESGGFLQMPGRHAPAGPAAPDAPTSAPPPPLRACSPDEGGLPWPAPETMAERPARSSQWAAEDGPAASQAAVPDSATPSPDTADSAPDAPAAPSDTPSPPLPVPAPAQQPRQARQDGDTSRQQQDPGAEHPGPASPAGAAAAEAPAWLQDTVQRIAWLCAQADPAFQSWSVTVPMDPAVLPESEVALTLSPYAMSLRFRTRSSESARLISLHRDPLRAQLEALGPGQCGIDIDLETPP
ncbi:Type III secretion protein (HpaP) [Paracidovorax cattleyae]|uniref:Type III secretion protein (HpaP) n=3 Tax=Paracidovorax cattleyae TaxID=80868 RepID=A0A1H0QBU6_9BURK|nr:Type III secretion protein (HpaP) [Paracidovorax cattleyae]